MTPPLAPLVLAVVVGKVALHLATSAQGYGYFGDELYYLACASRLDAGYVDHPPFSIGVLALWRGVFGDSLFALRALAALVGGAAAFASALLAREMGGGPRAQALCALAVALAPVHLVVHGYYSMNAWDTLVWVVAAIGIVRVLRAPTLGRWIGLGAVLGVGLLNKWSVLWLGAGLGVGLLLLHPRQLARPGPWAAGAVAVLLFSPHIVWQIAHGWPTLDFIASATSGKMLPVGPVALLAQQLLVWGLAAPLWIGGLAWLALARAARPHRIFAVIFGVVVGILVANGTSRPNYLALAVPPLVAGGAVALEAWSRTRAAWLPSAAAVLLLVAGLLSAPLTLPILSPERLPAFQEALGLRAPRMERRDVATLDPHFADMFGAREIAETTAAAWRSLPEAERAEAVILGRSYVEAGAVERFGRELGLPTPLGLQNSYWMWGPGERDPEVVLVLGGEREALEPFFGSIEAGPTWDCGHCLPGRNHQTVWIGRDPLRPLAEVWPELRRYE